MSYINNKLYRQFSDYRYMGIIDIINIATTVGYQHRLNLLRLPGMAADFSDLAFSTVQGDPCNFWLETPITSTAAQPVWIKPPEHSGLHSKLLIFYGKPQYSGSNGDSTFLFFDDFLGTALDTTNKWILEYTSGNYTVSIANSIFTFTNTDASTYAWYSNKYGVSTKNTTIEGRLKATTCTDSTANNTSCGIGDYPYINMLGSVPPAGTLVERAPLHNGVAWGSLTESSLSTTTWYILGARYDPDADIFYHSRDRGSWTGWTGRTAAANGEVWFVVQSGVLSQRFDIDWLLLRQYIATEPTLTINWWGKNPYYHKSLLGGIA